MTYKQRLLLVYHYLPQEGCFYEEVQEIMILNVLRRLKGFPCSRRCWGLGVGVGFSKKRVIMPGFRKSISNHRLTELQQLFRSEINK